jgi:hypothetical protein
MSLSLLSRIAKPAQVALTRAPRQRGLSTSVVVGGEKVSMEAFENWSRNPYPTRSDPMEGIALAGIIAGTCFFASIPFLGYLVTPAKHDDDH